MTIALCFALVGLCALAVSGLIYFARAALVRADGKGLSDTRVAERDGDLKVAARKVDDANTAVGEIDTALKSERERSDKLEVEASDAAPDPAGGNPWKQLPSDALEKP